jgi:hypothetical protein
MADWVRVDHAPAPTILSEDAWGYLSDRAAVVNAAVDGEFGHG